MTHARNHFKEYIEIFVILWKIIFNLERYSQPNYQSSTRVE